jgi:hypothetical protein
MSVAVLHNFAQEGRAAIAHTDIKADQFVKTGGIYKLNDFNRARFIGWSRTQDKPCPYYIPNNPGKGRSPEEYKYEPQSEKVSFSPGALYW